MNRKSNLQISLKKYSKQIFNEISIQCPDDIKTLTKIWNDRYSKIPVFWKTKTLSHDSMNLIIEKLYTIQIVKQINILEIHDFVKYILNTYLKDKQSYNIQVVAKCAYSNTYDNNAWTILDNNILNHYFSLPFVAPYEMILSNMKHYLNNYLKYETALLDRLQYIPDINQLEVSLFLVNLIYEIKSEANTILEGYYEIGSITESILCEKTNRNTKYIAEYFQRTLQFEIYTKIHDVLSVLFITVDLINGKERVTSSKL